MRSSLTYMLCVTVFRKNCPTLLNVLCRVGQGDKLGLRPNGARLLRLKSQIIIGQDVEEKDLEVEVN